MISVKGRTALVTGGAGFIGGRLVERLLGSGAARVRVLDLAPPAGGPVDPRLDFVRADLAAVSVDDLASALEGFEEVFHLAAVKHRPSLGDPGRLIATNVRGTRALLAAAVRCGTRKIVFSSSLYAHGRTAGPPLRESEAPRPATLYGRSKRIGERMLDRAARTTPLGGISLRLFFTYGPGQDARAGRATVIPGNFRRLLDGRPPLLRGDGDQVLDYVYVDDVVDALEIAMGSALRRGVFNVGSGEGIRIRDLVARMQSVAGTSLPVERQPKDDTAGSSRVADLSRVREALAWVPTTPLDIGLARTLIWERSQRVAAS
jgi:UDP-glucose 4-epimerase